jgi:hypothetical protein
MVYTVENGTDSTIGSSLIYPTNSSGLLGGTNFTDFAGVNGSVEYTTFNALADAQS